MVSLLLDYKETTPSRACWSSSVRGFFSLPSISSSQNRPYPINIRGAADTAGCVASRGSIPACTGKPDGIGPQHGHDRVYPRVYGETGYGCVPPRLSTGLSPRVRGNRRACRARSIAPRSIPACTGKPPVSATCGCQITVYPRVYGETGDSAAAYRSTTGLSPRVRGNPQPHHHAIFLVGSIPACTGKPSRRRSSSGGKGVYPRVYGETNEDVRVLDLSGGLSPRVRGNRRLDPVLAARGGSIPACTGKPLYASRHPTPPAVYPRVYGETSIDGVTPASHDGLSPRVRGNRAMIPASKPQEGSIPACTG